MKLPRDLSGTKLAGILKHYGYVVTKQSGSHMRLTTHQNGEHHVTVPAHQPLKVGTLSTIIKDVCEHLGIDRENFLETKK